METKPLTYKAIVEEVLADVHYLDWKFIVSPCYSRLDLTIDQDSMTGVPSQEENDDLFLQVQFTAPDNVTGVPELQKGRKWLIEYGTLPTQIVQAAWLAVQRAIMHEAAEQFTYKGATIFNRHIDIEALVKASKQVQ